jgi:hypothetical protein
VRDDLSFGMQLSERTAGRDENDATGTRWEIAESSVLGTGTAMMEIARIRFCGR